MIQLEEATEALVGELQSVLDEEIAILERKRQLLEELSSAMIERDEAAIEALLEHFDLAQQLQGTIDVKLSAVRAGLAEALGLPSQGQARARLTDLLRHLPITAGALLEVRRKQVQMLVESVRRQHMQTTMLLYESARLNRLMLEGMLRGSAGLTTYRPGGKDDWNGRGGLLDTRR